MRLQNIENLRALADLFIYNKQSLDNTEIIGYLSKLEKEIVSRHYNIASALIAMNNIKAEINISPTLINSFFSDCLEILILDDNSPIEFNKEYFRGKHSSVDIVHILRHEGTTIEYVGDVKTKKDSGYISDEGAFNLLIDKIGLDRYFTLITLLVYLTRVSKL